MPTRTVLPVLNAHVVHSTTQNFALEHLLNSFHLSTSLPKKHTTKSATTENPQVDKLIG